MAKHETLPLIQFVRITSLLVGGELYTPTVLFSSLSYDPLQHRRTYALAAVGLTNMYSFYLCIRSAFTGQIGNVGKMEGSNQLAIVLGNHQPLIWIIID